MGQGNSVEEWRTLFDKLDVDKSGRLNLRELLQSDLPELSSSSVGFLFRFDTSQEGTINFDEFQELIKHLRQLNSNSVPKKKVFSLRRLLKRESKQVESEQVFWKTIDSKEAADLILDRDSATPAFIGGNRGRKSSEEIEEERKKYLNDNERIKEQAIKREERKTRDYLEQSLKKSDGRKKFMDWLFKLADVDKSERVSSSELELVLKALAKDQMNTAQLSYDEEQTTPLLLQAIMCEYDIGKTGYLTKDEFMVLADLIVKNYDSLVEEQSHSKIVDDYILKWKLGEGGSGVVRLGVHKYTKEQFAIKIIPKGDESDLSRVDNEIKAMLMLKHQNVVNLEEVIEGDNNVYFVMELCGGGTIADYAAIHPLSDELAKYYFFQLINVVQYCHSKGVVHRDLKLENLLLDNSGVVHVSDFGHAGIFQQGWDMFSTAVGSLLHLSPEQINGECYSGEKTDTWAMGIVLYRMIVGKPPFFNPDINQLLNDIRSVNYSIPDFVSDNAKDLISLILKENPKDRPSLDSILQHPWFYNYKNADPLTMIYQISFTKQKLPINSLISSIRELNIVIVNATGSLPDNSPIFCLLKCHFTSKELKFSLSFYETVKPQIRHVRKNSKNLKTKSPKLKLKDEDNSKLSTSVPNNITPIRMKSYEKSRTKIKISNSYEGKKMHYKSKSRDLSKDLSFSDNSDDNPILELNDKLIQQEKLNKKRRRKRDKIVTIEVHLRQGNLLELKKIVDKIMNISCLKENILRASNS